MSLSVTYQSDRKGCADIAMAIDQSSIVTLAMIKPTAAHEASRKATASQLQLNWKIVISRNSSSAHISEYITVWATIRVTENQDDLINTVNNNGIER